MRSVSLRVTATVTIVALLSIPLQPALAGSTATLSGHVVSRDANRPVSGALVHVASVRTSEVLASRPVDADGAFSVADLPAEAVSVGVETDGTLFVSPTPVVLAAGAEQTLTVSIPDVATLAPAKTDDDEKKKKGGWWANPATGALTVVFLPILVGVGLKALDDDPEPEAPSPYVPPPTR